MGRHNAKEPKQPTLYRENLGYRHIAWPHQQGLNISRFSHGNPAILLPRHHGTLIARRRARRAGAGAVTLVMLVLLLLLMLLVFLLVLLTVQ